MATNTKLLKKVNRVSPPRIAGSTPSPDAGAAMKRPTPKAKNGTGLNRDKGNELHNGKKTQATTAGPLFVPNVANKPAPRVNITKGPLMFNEKDLKKLEAQFHVKTKKLYSLKTDFKKRRENLKEEYSSLIDLHDRIRSLTGRDFVPVEKLKFFDLSTEETPADTQSIKKYEDKGVGEFNVDYAVTITESEQEDKLWNELQTLQAQLKSAEDHKKEAEEGKAKLMETLKKAEEQHEAKLKETCTRYDALITEKNKSLSSIQEQNTLLSVQVREYKEEKKANENICSSNKKMEGQVSQLQQEVHDLQASLTDATDKNKDHQIRLSRNQLDIEERDRVISKQKEDLKACKEEIDFINSKQQENDEKIATLESKLDEQERHRNEGLYEANFQETCAKCEVVIIEKNKRNCQLEEKVKELMDSLFSTQEQNTLLSVQVREYKEEKKANENICSSNKKMEGQVSQLQQEVHDLQASLTDATDKNKDHQIRLSRNQLDIEERDRVISKQTEDLKACKEEIDFINREKKEEDENIATLEINSDDQVRHGKEWGLVLDLQTELARVDDKKERLEIALSHRGLEAEQKDCIIKEQSKKLAAYKKAIEELQKNQHKILPNLHVKYIHAEKEQYEANLKQTCAKYDVMIIERDKHIKQLQEKLNSLSSMQQNGLEMELRGYQEIDVRKDISCVKKQINEQVPQQQWGHLLDIQAELMKTRNEKECVEIALSRAGLVIERKNCIIFKLKKRIETYKNAFNFLEHEKGKER
ncbi:putative leucine-rich repeat-containing protein DDB_G0290503 isoform X1 [Zootermopsis nevadensis]|nr:putative leucine-rich repeat-containing protein DDB_G0290503 isoform X1 [Zootermopsis nevadensis]